ncbi:MAG TPA: hypothetical protein VMB03_01245 [Bryobacteraceae bacterium]|nr:hypothetical protein [Bryobacteraceae bacterium]
MSSPTSAPSRGAAVEVVEFGYRTSDDRKLLRQFVDFHWSHYENDPQYIPLLDYEYLGFHLIGMVGFFEPINLFLKHADMRMFLAKSGGKMVGRCNAFVNHNHNKHWKDKVGFFGQFESIDDPAVCQALVSAAGKWLKAQGMTTIRGPQNFPVNEATPGILTAGFDSRPVIYYHYSKPYYEPLLKSAGLAPVKRVVSWETEVQRPIEDKLQRLGQKIINRYGITIEDWGKRPLKERKAEMLDVYNDAWNDNWGFVPFEQDEFYRICEDMQLIVDKNLFLFIYVKGELAAFFGGVPNVAEKLTPIPGMRRAELLRAAKMVLGKGSVRGFRLGYLGVKRKFRKLGLDGVLIWKAKQYAQKRGYQYCDLGWILEDNVLVLRLGELMGSKPSKTYTIFEKTV